MKAFAVLENDEHTGAIFFADHAVIARRLGANEYGDGEFCNVSCRRAPWADGCAETGLVPAALMVANGWHFECTGCGVRIDEDLPHLDEDDGRYTDWSTRDIIGTQHSVVYCDQRCKDAHGAYLAEQRRRQERQVERFKKLVVRRFPEARLVNDPERRLGYHHAYCFRRGERWVVDQVFVAFEFPGSKFGAARLEYNQRSYGSRKPHFTCCGGDKDAFEAWARQQRAMVR